jgi:hypothetical protein
MAPTSTAHTRLAAYTYFDRISTCLPHHFENKSHYLARQLQRGGFAQMKAAVPKVLNVFQLGLKTKDRRWFGTDAVAGSHGHLPG